MKGVKAPTETKQSSPFSFFGSKKAEPEPEPEPEPKKFFGLF
jgi:hypothetical protein